MQLGAASFYGYLLYCQMYIIFAAYLLQIGGGSPILYGSFMTLNTMLVVTVEFFLVTAISHLKADRTMVMGKLLYVPVVKLCALIVSPLWFVIPVIAFTLGEMLFAWAIPGKRQYPASKQDFTHEIDENPKVE